MPDSLVKQIRIMISSTRADLAQYREVAAQVINKVAAEREKQVQLVELSMEKETQSGDREFAVAVSKRWVEEADWVVLIVGWNYGTISDELGANGLSVTEWEYRHACELGKKLFVFIAGSPGTADQYRVSSEEKEDLKDWIPKQTEQQSEKLKQFRQELSKPYTGMFSNLNAFRERLEKTLKNAIDDLPPNIQAGTPLAELIVAVTPDIRKCIRKVRLIANCKRLHDHLHELRQHVIRPLREEVLSVWNQEGLLSVSRERMIWGCIKKAERQLGAIAELRRSISPEHQGLRYSVDKVLERPELWTVESDSPDCRPTREEFTEVVDVFAEDVQDAFSEADQSMTREESDLREQYLALLEGLKRARQQTNLSPSDHQRLDEELEKVHANRSHVKESLTTHHRWQEAHNKLHELDSYRETGRFSKNLDRYRETGLARLVELVENELERPNADQTTTVETGRAAVGAAIHGYPQPRSPSSSQGGIASVDSLRCLKQRLEALRRNGAVVTFDNMRKPFDDAFYYVDKRTLDEVTSALRRVQALEEWLDGLATKEQKAKTR